MEVDKPKEPSETVDIEQQSVSLKPHEHKHEDGALHADLSPGHKSVETKAADGAAEAMEVTAGPESSCSPGEGMSLSGLQVLTEVRTVVLKGSWLPLESYI